MKKSLLFFLVVMTISIFQSCQKEPLIDNNPQGLVAPELPAAVMYDMPTEALSRNAPDTTVGQANGLTYFNWLHAGLNLLAWNTVVVVGMTPPLAAIGRAFNEDPQYIGNNTFEWAYQYNAPASIGGGIYDISLTGEYISNNEEVAWTLTASKNGGFSDFVWITGLTSTVAPTGEFIIYDKPNNPHPNVGINYNRNTVTGDEVTRFTNVKPGDPANGQYIEYLGTPNGDFNKGFNVQGAPNNYLEIQWNDPAGDGRVRHPLHFNDGDWHCWTTNRVDTGC